MKVVVGGGQLGAALVRHFAASGEPVRLLSRTPRGLPALWTRFDLAQGRWPSLPPDCTVYVTIHPSAGERPPWTALAQALPSLRVGQVVVCGPAGDPDFDVVVPFAGRVVRLTPLFGPDAPWLVPALRALRERGVMRVPRGLPPIWPLFVEDAARAVVQLEGSRTLKGPERVELDTLATTLCARSGARWGRPWWPLGAPAWAAPLVAQDRLPDGWEGGPRQSFVAWLSARAGAGGITT